MGMMDKMMAVMMGRMSKEEKERMMDKFFADMTSEDKQKMMAEMMPKMTEGGEGADTPMMPQMMMEMMPQCLKIMLPRVAKEQRVDFALTMITDLMELGSAEMSEEETADFAAKVIQRVGA